MKSRLFSMLPLLAMAIVPGLAFGNAIYDVSVDTSSLISNPAGPFQLDFQFTDGSGLGDANNTVTLSNFDFGSGAPLGTPTLTGGAMGDLSSSVTLTDSDSFFNDFLQSFTPGSTLSFRLDLTTNPESINVPDEFSFAILDSSFSGDPLLIADITANPSLSTFASSTFSIPAPNVSSVPEPSLGWPIAAAFCLLLIWSTRGGSKARKGLEPRLEDQV